MPDNDISALSDDEILGFISTMHDAGKLSTSHLMEVSEPNGDSDTGYVSRKTNLGDVALALNNEFEYSSELQTTSKAIIGAINELARLRTFNSGDIVSFPSQSAVFSGYVTGSNKSIYFYVPLPNPPKGITSATVTGAIGCRSAKGIINGGALNLSDYEVTATVTDYGVGINVKSTSDFTVVDNNTNIVVSPSSSGLRIAFN